MADFTASQLASMARQLFANGDLAGAEGLARRATTADAGLAAGWQLLAQVSLARGDIDAAQTYIARTFQPGRDGADLRRELLEAEVARRQAIAAARPGDAVAWFELGHVLQERRDMDAAQAAYEKALAIQPAYVAAKNNLGLALAECGEAAAGLTHLRQAMAVAREAEAAGVGSNLLYTMHFQDGVTGGELLAAHREWDARFAAGLAERRGPAFERGVDAGRRLKVGYVSAHFHQHSVGRFLLKLFENHDHAAVEVRCYSGGTKRDAVTARLRACAEGWVETAGIADAEVAEMIRADGVEVLVDLTMHMAGSRLGVFARRAAPVQVTYLAYCSTTGLSEMDFRLTDAALDPPTPPIADASGKYSERNLWLPGAYWCFEGVEGAEVQERREGPLVFGSLNAFSKVTRGAVEAWGDILREVAGSEILIQAPEGRHREKVLAIFEGAGVARGRVRFFDRLPLEGYLRMHGEIDVALDTMGYAGGTTTCDALWMGVPVVSVAGELAFRRGGKSILEAVGLGELVCETVEGYVERAAELARDEGRRRELRGSLRERMRGSALMDGVAFARGVEAAFRAAAGMTK